MKRLVGHSRRRIAESLLPLDADTQERRAHAHGAIEFRHARLREAAVLVPLVDYDGDYRVLLTVRTDHLHNHAGQVSFPGGAMEAGDTGPVDTALRETAEEVGIPPSVIEVGGLLDEYLTITGYSVTPVVGFVPHGLPLALDPFEVAECFELPLSFAIDPHNHQRHSVVFRGRRRYYYVIDYGRHCIWGATAGMLVNLAEHLSTA